MLREDGQAIAVVGAAGHVGRVLLRQLQEDGVRATAVVRGSPELSVDGDFHATLTTADLAAASRRFDVVINLAYPTSGPGYEYPKLNRGIADTVARLLSDGGRLIQVSTLAVFGLALDRPVSPQPVRAVRDDAYVEAKVAAERTFTALQRERSLSLDVVRLGNIWGYGSATWAATLVHKLVTGRPVGVQGAPAYSNTTDVENVASYLSFLAARSDRGAGVRYHHLAEFSDVRWQEWIAPLAELLDVEASYLRELAPLAQGSTLGDMLGAFESLKPRSFYRRLAAERVSGSWTRSLVGRLPDNTRERFKSTVIHAEEPERDRGEQTFLTIMAGRNEFASVVEEAWHPRLSREQSLAGVLRWLERD